MKSTWGRRKSGSARRIGLVSTVVPCMIAGTVGLTAEPGSAAPPPSGSAVQLAVQYLNALGPADSAIARAETALKALPHNASIGQVEAIVAPLNGRVDQLQAALAADETQSYSPMLLSRLGLPVIVEFYNSTGAVTGKNAAPWGMWRSSTAVPCLSGKVTSTMTMAGVNYSGMQLVGPTCAAGSVLFEASWHFGTAQSFSADIGLDSASARPSVTMGFVSAVGTLAHPTAWKPVPFTADGTSAGSGGIPVTTGVPTPVNVNLRGIHELTVLFLVDGPSPMIDLANGEFSS